MTYITNTNFKSLRILYSQYFVQSLLVQPSQVMDQS
jgi:hypothetical protein